METLETMFFFVIVLCVRCLKQIDSSYRWHFPNSSPLTCNDGPFCATIDASLTSVGGVNKSISVAPSIYQTHSRLQKGSTQTEIWLVSVPADMCQCAMV